MRFLETLLVVPDALNGGVLEPRTMALRWQYGVDVTIPVRVVHQDASAYSLAGRVTAILAFYANDTDDVPVLQLELDITGANVGDFSFPRSMATLLPYADRGYAIGVRFRDDDAGIEDATLSPASRAMIDRRIGDFDEPIATPGTAFPLATGPNFVPVYKAAAYTPALGELVIVDVSGGAVAITLPSSSGSGKRIGVVLGASAANPLTVARSGSDTINGSSSAQSLSTPWQIVTFVDVSGGWIASS